MEQNQGQRRSHFHRGRRGSDRRGIDRRSQPQPQERGGRDQVDVEQIMREIRGRIAQRQGIDLSNQQIQDLASRRLESILDPRAIKPSLLEALRRSAGTPGPRAIERIPNEPAFSFEDTTIYDSHRSLMRLVRRLLNPILKLFFNPNPLIRAMHIQARLNVEAAEREAERERRQTEWNALHYEIVQRLVTEVSRASLELQALSLRLESLSAKIDFNERRVRSMEGSLHRTKPQGAAAQSSVADQPAAATSAPNDEHATEAAVAGGGPASADGARRKRRRRRGRRPGMAPVEGALTQGEGASPAASPGETAAPELEAEETEISYENAERAEDYPSNPAAPSALPEERERQAQSEAPGTSAVSATQESPATLAVASTPAAPATPAVSSTPAAPAPPAVSPASEAPGAPAVSLTPEVPDRPAVSPAPQAPAAGPAEEHTSSEAADATADVDRRG